MPPAPSVFGLEVYYELKLRDSEVCALVLLKGMPNSLKLCNSCIGHLGVLSLVTDSLFKKAHSRFDFTYFAQHERTQVNLHDSFTS